MKRGIRVIALVLALIMLIGVIASSFSYAKAEGQWEKDVFAYGAGLNEDQVKKTAELLKAEESDKVNKIKVTAEDLYKYLKMTGDDASMISSIYAMKAEKGTGVEIVITTPENITQVTGAEYTNAALTAGITDAKIHVGAVRPVTGTSALTGVYKAFELNGEELDKGRVEAANEELETVNAIVQEHKDDEKFSVENMNNVIIYIKDSLIQFKEDNKEVASPEKVKEIVNQGVEKYNLNGVISQVNIDNLNVYFQNFQKTAAVDSKELKGQLEDFSKDLESKAGDFIDGAKEGLEKGSKDLKKGAEDAYNKAKEYVNSEEAKGFFAQVTDFLGDLFTKIGDFFSNLFK